MVAPAAYPCARCGSPLRWIAATGVWACDACKVGYPAQGAAPPPTAAPARMRARRALTPKQKILVVAGAGSGVLLLGIALVLALGGQGGGKASPEDLFKAAIDRAVAGDGDGLVALSGLEKALEVLDCSGSEHHGKAWRDELAADRRKDLTDHLDKWKGLTITVKSVEPTGDPDVRDAGSSEDGCQTKSEVTEQRFRVKVTVAAGDGAQSDTELRFRAAKVDGLWYLDDMPSPPAAGGLAKLRHIKDEMCACKDNACVQGIQKDLEQFGKDMADSGAAPDDGAEQRQIINDLTDCEVKAMSNKTY